MAWTRSSVLRCCNTRDEPDSISQLIAFFSSSIGIIEETGRLLTTNELNTLIREGLPGHDDLLEVLVGNPTNMVYLWFRLDEAQETSDYWKQ